MPDCTATAPEAVRVGEPHTPPSVGWPAALVASPQAEVADLVAMRRELEDAFAAFTYARRAQDTIPSPGKGSPLDVAYQAAMEHHCAAVYAWTDFEPTTPAELVAKAAAMMSPAADEPQELDGNAFIGLCSDVARVVRPGLPPQLSALLVRWDEAFGRWSAALDALRSAEATVYAIEDAVAAECPVPEALRRGAGDTPDAFYVDAEQIWQNNNLTAAAKVKLAATLLEHIDLQIAAGKRSGESAAEEALCQAGRVYRDAANALLATEAPDLHAVLVKLRVREVIVNDATGRYEDFDDPAKLSELLTSSDRGEMALGYLFQDMVRLT